MINFGVRSLFLLAAAILFVLAVVSESDYADLIAWGLAALSLALLLTDIGWDRKYGTRR